MSSRFKKDIKRFQHDKKVQDKLEQIIETLIYEKKLPAKNKDHDLVGDYIRHRECHISPDVLLIYYSDEDTLHLERIGSHSELF